MDAYRDQHHNCPRCNHLLRTFNERLVCDACEGLMLAEDDLRNAVLELTGFTPAFLFHDEAPGKRACPRCATAMTTARLSIQLEDTKPTKPGPELDRCAAHGLWFDESELAAVLEPIASKGVGGGMAKTSSARESSVAAPRPSTDRAWKSASI